MKKIVSITLAVMVILMALSGCGAASGNSLFGSVSTNGSTSMEKVIGILSEQFMEDNKDVTITYDATGSGTGIEAAASGTCDIGLASRNLKEEEIAKGLTATTLALDGIAIIVNENCPVDNLSVAEIAAIFMGEITDWSYFGGNGSIACIGREAGSGTRDGFESITKTADKCVLAQELTSTGAVIAAVAGSTNAIGYAPFASVEGQPGIKVLTVDGISCTAENIVNGSYVIQRPFNLVVKADSKLSDTAQAFFDFMISGEADELIKAAGCVPAAK